MERLCFPLTGCCQGLWVGLQHTHTRWFRRVKGPASTCCILMEDLEAHGNMSVLKCLPSLKSYKIHKETMSWLYKKLFSGIFFLDIIENLYNTEMVQASKWAWRQSLWHVLGQCFSSHHVTFGRVGASLTPSENQLWPYLAVLSASGQLPLEAWRPFLCFDL